MILRPPNALLVLADDSFETVPEPDGRVVVPGRSCMIISARIPDDAPTDVELITSPPASWPHAGLHVAYDDEMDTPSGVIRLLSVYLDEYASEHVGVRTRVRVAVDDDTEPGRVSIALGTARESLASHDIRQR